MSRHTRATGAEAAATSIRGGIVSASVRAASLAQGCGEPHCHACGRDIAEGEAWYLRRGLPHPTISIVTLAVMTCAGCDAANTPIPDAELAIISGGAPRVRDDMSSDIEKLRVLLGDKFPDDPPPLVAGAGPLFLEIGGVVVWYPSGEPVSPCP